MYESEYRINDKVSDDDYHKHLKEQRDEKYRHIFEQSINIRPPPPVEKLEIAPMRKQATSYPNVFQTGDTGGRNTLSIFGSRYALPVGTMRTSSGVIIPY